MLVLCSSGPESRLQEAVSPPSRTAPQQRRAVGVAREMAGGSLPLEHMDSSASLSANKDGSEHRVSSQLSELLL